MTITVGLIALAHALPVLFLGLLTRSKFVLLVTTALAILVAVGTGSAKYLVFDLLAIGVAYYFCSSAIGPKRPALRARSEQALVAPQRKESDFLALLLGVAALTFAGAAIFSALKDKPRVPTTPTLSSRLTAYVAELENERFSSEFPLVNAQVHENTLYLTFRSIDQTTAQFTKRYEKIDFARAYSTHYCSSRAAAPLLAAGAKIVVSLSDKDANLVRRYQIGKSNCDDLAPASSTTPASLTT